MTDSVEELSPISFKSILPDSKDVRVTNINGVAHVWAVDLVFAMKGKTRGDAARLLREVPEALFSSKNMIIMPMPGTGNARTKLVASDLVCSLAKAIPSIKSEKLKRDACDIINSHFGLSTSASAEDTDVNMRGASADEAAVDEVEEVARGIERFSLASIIPNSEDVRVTNIDGVQYIWAVDLIVAVTGKDKNQAGEILRNLLATKMFAPEKLWKKVLPGNGRWDAKLVTVEDAVELILASPGPGAKTIRRQASNFMVRALGGDPTLIKEIEENAVSNAPINRIARASLAGVPPKAVVKRVCIAQSQESPQAIHVARNNEIIFDAFQKYMEIQERAQDPKARSTFSEMLMNNTQTLLATPAIDKPQPEPGYIYCLQSSRYPDEVKIGRAPRIYKINKEYRDQNEDIVLTYRYSVRTLDYKRDEKLAHDYFASVREPCKGELFRTTPEKVRDFFEREIRPRYHQECATDVDMDEGEEEDMDVEI